MTRVDEFDAFYHDTRRHVLHQAYAMTGDLTAAVSAVQDAYAHAWQHWPKLRTRDPLGQVRPEAMRLAALRHGTNLLRRRRRDDTDSELLSALGDLTSTGRRLVILQATAGLDVTGAAREVGLISNDAVHITDQAVIKLTGSLGATVGEIESRLHALRHVTDAATLPRASIVRRVGTRRKHRNTLVAVAGSAVMIVLAGYVVTAPADGRTDSLHPTREKIGNAEPDEEQPKIGATQDQLLSAPQIVHLDLKARWRAVDTSSTLDATKPFTACARARYGSSQLRQVWVRTFQGKGKVRQKAIESIEVARTRRAARQSYRRQLSWYAGCQVPRMQLLDAYAAERKGHDIRILVLRKWSDPIRTITVGVARSGFVTSSFVHQVDRRRGPQLQVFSTILDDSLGLMCGSTGGPCQLAGEVHAVAPPATGEGRGFLGSVDLPPVANLAKRWIGVKVRPRPNPSLTPCDETRFDRKGISEARSRVYVLNKAKRLPRRFGISETIAKFRTENRATQFVRKIERRVSRCKKKLYSATRVSQPHRAQQGSVKVRTWYMKVKPKENRTVEYRLGVVRNGNRVAQVMFTPVRKYDIRPGAFNAMTMRAGHRLAELDE